MEININREEEYVFIDGLTAEEASGVWARLLRECPNFEVDFAFNVGAKVPKEFLAKIGASLLEESVKMQLLPENLAEQPTADFVKIDEDNFEDFAAHHDKQSPEMYWNSDRIWETLPKWEIFAVYESTNISDYIMFSVPNATVFAMDGKNTANKKALLHLAAKKFFVISQSPIFFYAEKSVPDEQEIAGQMGFTPISNYCVYRIIVPS